MTGKQTFVDYWAVWKIVAIGFVISALMVVVWLFIAGAPKSAVMWSILGVVILLGPIAAFIASNLTTHRTVSCDLVECQMHSGSNWGGSQTENFKWNDVTGTGIDAKVTMNGRTRQVQYFFGVGVDGKEIVLLGSGTKDFDNLLAVVSERTPQLPYFWSKRKNAGHRQVLQQVEDYCKVARN